MPSIGPQEAHPLLPREDNTTDVQAVETTERGSKEGMAGETELQDKRMRSGVRRKAGA